MRTEEFALLDLTAYEWAGWDASAPIGSRSDCVDDPEPAVAHPPAEAARPSLAPAFLAPVPVPVPVAVAAGCLSRRVPARRRRRIRFA